MKLLTKSKPPLKPNKLKKFNVNNGELNGIIYLYIIRA